MQFFSMHPAAAVSIRVLRILACYAAVGAGLMAAVYLLFFYTLLAENMNYKQTVLPAAQQMAEGGFSGAARVVDNVPRI